MSVSYGVGIKNRFALFMGDESDTMELSAKKENIGSKANVDSTSGTGATSGAKGNTQAQAKNTKTATAKPEETLKKNPDNKRSNTNAASNTNATGQPKSAQGSRTGPGPKDGSMPNKKPGNYSAQYLFTVLYVILLSLQKKCGSRWASMQLLCRFPLPIVHAFFMCVAAMLLLLAV